MKKIKMFDAVIIIRSALEEDDTFCSQIFLVECLYKLVGIYY